MAEESKKKSPDENIDYNNRFKKNIKSQKAALKKAWEVRNYEIDKFWQRSMFFWGFISVLFAGYGYLVTSDNNLKEMHFDLYIILLGIIFSVAWFLVAKAGKYYQENWEVHIDRLEYEIMGPLYKTVLKPKGLHPRSVSKITIALTFVVIGVWLFLFIRYFYDNNDWLKCFLGNLEKCIFIWIPVILTVICILYFFICCKTGSNRCCFKTNKNGFYDRIKESDYKDYYDENGKYIGE